MIARIVKFIVLLFIFGLIFYLINLYDSQLLIIWKNYEITISAFFLAFIAVVFYMLLIKIFNFLAYIIHIPENIRNFFVIRKDQHNIKLLLQAFTSLAENDIDRAEKMKAQLEQASQGDKLFKPYIEDLDKLKSLLEKGVCKDPS